MAGAMLLLCLWQLGGPSELAAQERRRMRYPGVPDIREPDEAMDMYREYISRPSWWKQFMGQAILANSKHPAAIEQLYKDYGKPSGPKEEHRTLLAHLLTVHFRDPEYWTQLQSGGEKYRKGKEHTWLQYRLLRLQCRNDEAPVHAIARDPKAEPLRRASALEALAAEASVSSLDLEAMATVDLVMADLPRKEDDANMLVESALELMRAYSRHRNRPRYGDAITAFLDRMGDRRSELRHKIILSRMLGLIFEVENLGVSPKPWQPILDGKPISEVTGTRSDRAGTSADFFGIQSITQRVVYVVDASDSMLEKVIDKEALLKPVTGKSSGPADTRTPEEIALDLALPWDRINTRFDAAIAFLELSLKRLTKHQSFAVVLFGDEATTIRATGQMIPASQKNIKKAIAELLAIKPGPVVQNRPNGTLRGKTNLHGGLKLAFELQDGKRRITSATDVDVKAIGNGADTIFVLSDGDPTWDNWPEEDTPDDWDQAGDPEAKTNHEMHPTLTFQGPMSYPEWLLVDLERLNTLRKVQIHAVGFGDVQRSFLRRIAKLGDGEALKLGI